MIDARPADANRPPIGGLARLLGVACDACDASVALRGDGSATTYAELRSHARTVAAALVAAGIAIDEPVQVAVSNHPTDIAALFGVWLAGGVAVPVHRTTPAPVAARMLASTELVDIYGLTETATCDFFAFPSDYARLPGCIGRSSPGVRFRIVDLDDQVVAAGAIGELQIASPYAMAGYLDAPELTAAAYDDAWFRTGDLARSADGALVELMGRRKEVISRGGNKVTPVEIEQAVSVHPDVAAAMATGIDDPLLGERIHVLLVPRSGARLDVGSMQRFLDGWLERFKQPDAYYVAEELPTGRTGKADRNRLRALIHEGAVQPLAPSSARESP